MRHLINSGYILLLTLATSHAMYFWDLNDTSPGAGGPSPSGTWGVDAYWNEDGSGGGANGPLKTWGDGFTAVFAAGDDAVGAYTVLVNGVIDVSDIHVDLGEVTFAPDPFAGGAFWGADRTNRLFSVGHKSDTSVARYDIPITGGYGIIRYKKARMILGATNTYAGPTRIEGGILELGTPFAVPPGSNLILANDDGRDDVGAIGLANSTPSTFHTGGFSQRLGTLELTGPSPSVHRTIDFGDGASVLEFADSRDSTWLSKEGSDIQLHVLNYSPGADVWRVGSDSLGLTSRQLGLIRFEDLGGISARIDSQGYVFPNLPLTIQQMGTVVEISWPAGIGKKYAVEAKNTVSDAWVPEPGEIVADTEIMSRMYSKGGTGQFYRVRMVP